MSLSYPETLKGIVAASGDKNDIPSPAQAAGFASFAEGFGPINGLPLASGGIAPKREDINGFLNLLSQHNFWQQSGGMYTWANTLDYAVPSMVVGSDGVIYFALLASGPGTGAGYKDPTTEPTYWVTLQSLVGSTLATLVQAVVATSTTTALTPQGFAAANLSGAGKTVAAGGSADVITATIASGLTALTDGMEVNVRMAYANATTTPTFNLTLGSTATGAYTIVTGALAALAVGSIAGAGFEAILKWNATASKWVLKNPSIASTFRYASSTTAAGTSAKVATLPGFSLATGAAVFVTFTNANSVAGALTLNVNSTGDIAIYDEAGNAISSTNPAYFLAAAAIEFVYDGTHWIFKNSVVQNYINGTSWYRRWANGWIEQGGWIASTNSSAYATSVTLLLAHKDSNYYWQRSTQNNSGTNVLYQAGFTSKSTSSVSFHMDGTAYIVGCNWHSSGF